MPKGFELLSTLSHKGKLLFSETQTTLCGTKNKIIIIIKSWFKQRSYTIKIGENVFCLFFFFFLKKKGKKN